MESVIIVLSCFIAFNLLAGLEGFVRAHYEDYVYFADRKHRNLHPWYFIIRGIVLAPFAFVVYQASSFTVDSQWAWVVNALLFSIAGSMSYSFFYLGVLYTWRNNLAPEIYKDRFYAEKERGEDVNSAKMELNFGWRAAMFFMSLIFILGIILDLLNL